MTTKTATSGAMEMVRWLRSSLGSVHLVRVPASAFRSVLAKLKADRRRYYAVQTRPRDEWALFVSCRIDGYPSERAGLRADELAAVLLEVLEGAASAVEHYGSWWRPPVGGG